MSVADDVAAEVLSILTGLALTMGAGPVTVVQRKVVAVDPAVDVLPMIVLTPPRSPDSQVPFDTGTDGTLGRRRYEYSYGLTLVAAGNRDLVTGLADYRDVRERVALRFGRATPLVTAGVLHVEFIPDVVLDPAAIDANYDYSPMGLLVSCVQTST